MDGEDETRTGIGAGGVERRGFLKGAALAGAAVVTATGAAATAAAATRGVMRDREDELRARYRETEHVKRYYFLNRL